MIPSACMNALCADTGPSAGFCVPPVGRLGLGSDVLSSARDLLHQLSGNAIARQARLLLAFLQGALSSIREIDEELVYLPQMQSHYVEDGSLLFEWILPNFRIGFNVEPDPSESGWFLVTNESLGSISASGYLSGISPIYLMMWLLSFVVSHS